MALPRSTKTSSHISTTASATRQAHKKTRKHSDDEKEEMDEYGDAEAMDIDDGELEKSQTTSAQELIANMVEGVSA